ncbi:Iron-regulated ABC transporter permease protein SufD [Chthonomonas calidirosea]|uniref:Iron-regulated ABC transporter permease protein SufD n=1 Tax=Chthonomonas calidirosea (strain DSM 23976 / ICMP 18418 / T49) TaxID=1303518 RepID=S0EXB8_CHTCT|nr:Fe-S cluster assembly protein SufD [Chthonomonas calidirosea]CCW34433.1 Iron-regulated ABC transporter permease protein SufD [Chthonomonas calidirosea T49]CEK14786.1 Iron-regulated ABC transporter permease protein SufD [Chthonomonas calidirosea]
MTVVTDTLPLYRAEYERFRRSAPGPEWLIGRQQEAFTAFESLGFPQKDDEEWRFTPIAPLVQTPFHLPVTAASLVAQDIQSWLLVQGASAVLVFLNGRFQPQLSAVSEGDGAIISDLRTALQAHPELLRRHLAQYTPLTLHTFVALNTAFFDDAAVIYLPHEAQLEKPIYLLFISAGTEEAIMSTPRVLVVAEEASEASVIECYAGASDKAYFTNSVTEIVAAPGSILDHYRVNLEGASAFHVSYTHAEIHREASFTSHSLTLGGRWVRNEVYAKLQGEKGYCLLNGLYLGTEQQIIDNHTTIDHAAPACESHEFYKGILDGHSHGIFNGKIYVRPQAQKTDAKQTNQGLLLSRNAQINSMPQLKIYADDVKCTHGATVGQLSKEALFYLRTRGIDKEEAEAILIRAFAMDIINRMRLESLKEALDTVLLERLSKGRVVEARK